MILYMISGLIAYALFVLAVLAFFTVAGRGETNLSATDMVQKLGRTHH